MDIYKPKVIALTKKPSQSFGFNLREERGEEGHLIRCLEMGGTAELAGMKDGDRILRVNGTFIDSMSHSEVVDLVRRSGASVTFHVLGASAYKKAKEQGINLSDPQSISLVNGNAKHGPKPKLCYMVKSSSGFGFSIRSVTGKFGLFMTEVISGGPAHRAGVQLNDRLIGVNGDNIENRTHEEVVERIIMSGSSIMLLLADNETDKFYENKRMKINIWEATTEYLPHKPRIVNLTADADGYGFILREEPNKTGHYIKNIDRGSPAARSGIKEMDRLVAVNGKEVDNYSHDMVVDLIRQSGRQCCLFVMDSDTDKMYKLGNVSPMMFWDESQDASTLPSYNEAISFPSPPKASTSFQSWDEELKPKLCKMEKTAQGFGFHLNGIQGIHGQYIKNVVKGGVADRAGMEEDDIVVEVNGVNVEQCSHEEAVGLIRSSGDTLEMLVAKKSVYDQLKAKGVAITSMLLVETLYAQVHKSNSPEIRKTEKQEEPRVETPTEPKRQRTPSVSSNSSVDSVDERL